MNPDVHLFWITMFCIGDNGDLLALSNFHFQFGQLVLLGHWLCLQIFGMTFLKLLVWNARTSLMTPTTMSFSSSASSCSSSPHSLQKFSSMSTSVELHSPQDTISVRFWNLLVRPLSSHAPGRLLGREVTGIFDVKTHQSWMDMKVYILSESWRGDNNNVESSSRH